MSKHIVRVTVTNAHPDNESCIEVGKDDVVKIIEIHQRFCFDALDSDGNVLTTLQRCQVKIDYSRDRGDK